MDILKYSALNVINSTCAFINGGANTAANTIGFANGNAAGGSANDAPQWTANGLFYTCSQRCAQYCNDPQQLPWCFCSWLALIPRMPGSTGTSNAGINCVTGNEYCGFKVCATNFYGANSCTWTVPAGAQYARFQIWGAGGGTGSGCCCGGSHWGTSGAYASVIIPVTPGCQYTLCAGCAIATPLLWGSGPGRSCRSFVTGYGLCNFCAEGACHKRHFTHKHQDMDAYYQSGCCRWAATWCANDSGGCICNSGNDWCFSGSCASCGLIGFSRSPHTLYYGCYNGPVSAYNSILNIDFLDGMQVVGIPGLNGSACWDTNYYGPFCSTAVYGYETVTASQHIGLLCSQGSTTGGICCNHVGYNYRRAPGAGGTVTILFGGCTAMCDPSGNLTCGGDIGRTGMVCVT